MSQPHKQKLKSTITLAAVGDIGLIRNVRKKISENSLDFPFKNVENLFKEADLTFGNLEMPFSDGPPPLTSKHSTEFWADVNHAPCLQKAGFDVLSFANNHTLEQGKKGMDITLTALDQLGISSVGAGNSYEQARQLVVKSVQGIKIGFLAYAKRDPADTRVYGSCPLVSKYILADVTSAQKTVDILVVSLHFGMIYMDYPSDEGIALCHSIIDHGADVILGHHPHVLQGIEEYQSGIIAYSLGEFIFDPEGGLWYSELGRETRKESIILNINLSKDGYEGHSFIETVMNCDYQPIVPIPQRRAEIENRLKKLSESIKNMSSSEFYKFAGKQLMKYEINAFLYHLRRLNFSYFLEKMLKIRIRHLKLLVGYFKSKLENKKL